VTEVTAATIFYPAEDYHQGYFEQNPISLTASLCGAEGRKSAAKYASRLKD